MATYAYSQTFTQTHSIVFLSDNLTKKAPSRCIAYSRTKSRYPRSMM
jgi:hypothetical protein